MPRALSDLEKAAHEFLFNRDSESAAVKSKNRARDVLKGWLTLKNAAGKMLNGDVDDKGNRTLYFEEPLTIGETEYAGVQAQKKTPEPSIDTDATEALLKAKGAKHYDAVFKRQVIRVFSEDDLYVLNQKGIVSDEELDALMVTGDPTYALVAVKS